MKERVDVCGVPESEWSDGVCYRCRSQCQISEYGIVSKRAYDYADRHFLLDSGYFWKEHIRIKLELIGRKKKVPKYLRDEVSFEGGRSFKTLDEFPCGKPFRCCRDSKDGTFQVGDTVWRDEPRPGIPDGLNIAQAAGCLDAEFCKAALEGALFEESFADIPRRNR